MSEAGREPDDLSAFCCQNPQCSAYGLRGQGNLTAPMRYGPQRRRLLRCKTCKARFSERKGTPLYRSGLPPEKALATMQPGAGFQVELFAAEPTDQVERSGQVRAFGHLQAGNAQYAIAE